MALWAARSQKWMGLLWQLDGQSLPPLTGLPAARGAVGEYNGKFIELQMVLRGGSFLTPAQHARPTLTATFFPPGKPLDWPAALRLARTPS